nr:hypothetical protein [Pseudomonas sp.]
MSIDTEYLLSRLPAFYRERDAEQGGPLRALLEIIAEQGDLLEADIAGLYDNWFIETCDDWLIPYVGELLGVRGLYPVAGTGSYAQRALVANTLRLRRRKGTVPVLEQLAFDTTGWRARAVEFFELLATTQHLNHRRLHNLRTPDLRDSLLLERLDGPFDRCAHTGDVRPLPAGRHNISNIGLYLWRLQAYGLQRATARAAPGFAGRYYFDALGRTPLGRVRPIDGLLYNRPRTEVDITQLAEPVHIPEPLSRRALHDELTALRQALTDGKPPMTVYFAPVEGGPVLRIWLDGVEVPAEHMLVCNLALLDKADPGDPDDWRRPPQTLSVTRSDRTLVQTFPSDPSLVMVAIDPLLGRIALPAGKMVGKVEVAYAYAFPGDVGGGPYDRRPSLREDDAGEGLMDPAAFDVHWRVPDDHPTLSAALSAVQAGTRTLVQILSDATEALAPALNLPDTHLAIEAANHRRPVLQGDWSLQGNANTQLTLSGLLLDGNLQLKGPLSRVDVRHCTLHPEKGGISHSNTGSALSIRLTHCLCGPVRATRAIGEVEARDCLFDNGEDLAFELPDTLLNLERCTVFGGTRSGMLYASNSLFTDSVDIVRKQEGCMRFCYVPPASQTPRRYRCQPDLVMQDLSQTLARQEGLRVTPGFTAARYGSAAYGQLTRSTAPEIRTGAENGAEMGVWNLLLQPQREANLHQALEEYLRVGLEAGLILVN